MSRGVRPERSTAQASAEAFYSVAEADKYDSSSRMAKTQRHLAERALHLLQLDKPHCLLLDLGCGTGFSGTPLERAAHARIGLDLSEPMLLAARAPRKRRDLAHADIGARLPLRQRLFDGALSISAVQWLCFPSKAGVEPRKRISTFFRGLRAVLAPGARAALQVYPEEPAHMQMLRDGALSAGFSGSLLVDYPKSERSKKLFLVLVSPQQRPKSSRVEGGDGGAEAWRSSPKERKSLRR